LSDEDRLTSKFIVVARRLLITGTDARVGKTTVACALGFAMRARGIRVGVMKPLDSPDRRDAQSLALAVGSTLPTSVISPDAVADISRFSDQIASQSDVVIVELSNAIDFADLAAILDPEIILVVGNRPGCVEAMTQALQRCERRALKLAGCILCDCEPAPHVETLEPPPGVAYLGRMRHREPLSKSIVEKII